MGLDYEGGHVYDEHASEDDWEKGSEDGDQLQSSDSDTWMAGSSTAGASLRFLVTWLYYTTVTD